MFNVYISVVYMMSPSCVGHGVVQLVLLICYGQPVCIMQHWTGVGAVRLLVSCKTAYLLCRGDCQIVAAVEDMVCVLISNYLSVLSKPSLL